MTANQMPEPTNPHAEETLEWVVADSFSGDRIDKYVAESAEEGVSRTQVQDWIKSGAVLVNGRPVKANYKLAAGDLDGTVERFHAARRMPHAVQRIRQSLQPLKRNALPASAANPVGALVHRFKRFVDAAQVPLVELEKREVLAFLERFGAEIAGVVVIGGQLVRIPPLRFRHAVVIVVAQPVFNPIPFLKQAGAEGG